MADCLKCSVVTHREPGQNKDDTDKFSYVDIKDSGYLPLLGLHVIPSPSKFLLIFFIVSNLRTQEGFSAKPSKKQRELLLFCHQTDSLLFLAINGINNRFYLSALIIGV